MNGHISYRGQNWFVYQAALNLVMLTLSRIEFNIELTLFSNQPQVAIQRTAILGTLASFFIFMIFIYKSIIAYFHLV